MTLLSLSYSTQNNCPSKLQAKVPYRRDLGSPNQNLPIISRDQFLTNHLLEIQNPSFRPGHHHFESQQAKKLATRIRNYFQVRNRIFPESNRGLLSPVHTYMWKISRFEIRISKKNNEFTKYLSTLPNAHSQRICHNLIEWATSRSLNLGDVVDCRTIHKMLHIVRITGD